MMTTIIKYKDLITEIQCMWNVKANVTAILKSLRRYLSNIPGEHEIKELPTTVILGSAHILQNVLM